MGSLFVLPAQTTPEEGFDHGDLYDAQTILIRLGDIAFIAVLNDSCAVTNLLQDRLKKLTAPLSTIQLRELMARAAWHNLHLKNRPVFHSQFDDGHQTIAARTAKTIEVTSGSASEFGELHFAASKDVLEAMKGTYADEIQEHVKNGVYSFLFDDSGNFLVHSQNDDNG